MEQTFFYVVGIALVILALAVSFFGLRAKDWPGSRTALLGGFAVFVVLVVATAAGAVINARDEQEHRRAELAEEAATEEVTPEQEAGAEAAQAEQTGGEGPSGASQAEANAAGEGAAGAAETLELSSPEDGSLSFDPGELEAAAGEVTIEYTNPSQVGHNVALDEGGEILDEGEIVTGGDVSSASAELDPGEYLYYCTVPGHREGGMEGTLRVK